MSIFEWFDNLRENNKAKLTSEQIWQLNKMNYASQKVNLDIPYNNIESTKVSLISQQDKIKVLEKTGKIVGNCESCGTGYFDNDRSCVACGYPIKISKKEEIKNSENISKKYVCSVANVFSYNESDNLLFTGVSLLSSSIEIKENDKINKTLQYVYYHSESELINIYDVDWKISNDNFPKIMKLVLEIQIASVDEYSNTIEILQYVIPRARVTQINSISLSAIPLAVRYNNVEDIYGYINYG